MPFCAANTLAINRPTKDAMFRTNATGCQNGTDLRPTDPLNVHQLSPRRQREQIREQLKDYIILKLGGPVVKLELDEQQLDLAVDEALMIFEDYCPREYFQYYVFNTVPGKSVYTLPPDVGLVRNVFYKQEGSFAFQASDLGGALPIEYFYPGGAYSSIQGGLIDPVQPIWGRMGEWTLYKQYEQMYSRVASNIGGWEWVGGFNNIKIYPVPFRVHRVIVHYLQKRTDFREVTQGMQEGALIFAKEMLGRIRSKYKNPPGPNGGVQLDGAELLQEAREDKEKWYQNLMTKYGDLLYISLG